MKNIKKEANLKNKKEIIKTIGDIKMKISDGKKMQANKDIERLIEALGDEDMDIVYNALDELVKIGEPAVEPLVKACRNALIYKRATYGEFPSAKDGISQKFLPWMASRIADGTYKYYLIYDRATEALGEIGYPATESLIRLLIDDDEDMRLLAAYALGKAKDQKAVDPLIEALGDKSIRNTVLNSLREIGGEKAGAAVKRYNAFGKSV